MRVNYILVTVSQLKIINRIYPYYLCFHLFRAIVIVRHPLDATISGYSFFKTKGSHTKTAPLEKFIKNGLPTKGKKTAYHIQNG